MRLSSVALATCAGLSTVFAQETPTAGAPGAQAPTTAPVAETAPAKTVETRTPGVIELPGIRKLKIGGEYRLRYEDRYNYDFDNAKKANDDFFTQRARLDFDLVLDDQFSAFVQLQDVRFWGEEAGSTTSRTSPGLDLHQAYLDVGDLAGGTGRFGRQVLSYGDQRLVGALEWLSQGRAFDGVRQRWMEKDEYRVDVFATQVRETTTALTPYDDAYFMGAYGTMFLDKGEAEFYGLFRHDEETPAGGLEGRATVGARWVQKLGNLEFGAEAATQFGEKDDQDIPIFDTYAAHVHGKLNFDGTLAPFVRIDGDAASGDDPATADNERFDNLYPTAHAHLGMMDFVLWENILHASAAAGLKPSEKTRLEVAWHWFQAMEETDRVAGPNGVLTTGGVGFGDDLGNEIDLLYNIDLGGAAVKGHLQVGYGVFLPGDATKRSSGGDDTAQFVYVQGGAKF